MRRSPVFLLTLILAACLTLAAAAPRDVRPLCPGYERPVSGDRGTVTQWAAGTYELLADSGDELALRLASARLTGTARLARNPGNPQRWVFSLAED